MMKVFIIFFLLEAGFALKVSREDCTSACVQQKGCQYTEQYATGPGTVCDHDGKVGDAPTQQDYDNCLAMDGGNWCADPITVAEAIGVAVGEKIAFGKTVCKWAEPYPLLKKLLWLTPYSPICWFFYL